MPIPKLLQLARDNAAASKPLRAETSGTEATNYLHGVVGGWWGDIDETEFVKALAGITADTIHLRIDSPGGDVFGARAMMTAIAQHPAKVIAHVDGLAASAAIGNKSDMRKTGDLLEKIDGDLANGYARRTGKDTGEITAWMDEETWFTADEAVANGFADRKVEVVKERGKNTWNLSAYKNAPKPEEPKVDDIDVAALRNTLERRFSLLERVPA